MFNLVVCWDELELIEDRNYENRKHKKIIHISHDKIIANIWWGSTDLGRIHTINENHAIIASEINVGLELDLRILITSKKNKHTENPQKITLKPPITPNSSQTTANSSKKSNKKVKKVKK